MYDSIYMRYVNFIETESRMAFARGWGKTYYHNLSLELFSFCKTESLSPLNNNSPFFLTKPLTAVFLPGKKRILGVPEWKHSSIFFEFSIIKMQQWVTFKIQFLKKLKTLFTEEKKKIKEQGQNIFAGWVLWNLKQTSKLQIIGNWELPS